MVAAGAYRVVLTVNGVEYSQNLKVELDPLVGDSIASEDELGSDEEDEEAEEMGYGEPDSGPPDEID
jgi:hypothetical protein